MYTHTAAAFRRPSCCINCAVRSSQYGGYRSSAVMRPRRHDTCASPRIKANKKVSCSIRTMIRGVAQQCFVLFCCRLSGLLCGLTRLHAGPGRAGSGRRADQYRSARRIHRISIPLQNATVYSVHDFAGRRVLNTVRWIALSALSTVDEMTRLIPETCYPLYFTPRDVHYLASCILYIYMCVCVCVCVCVTDSSRESLRNSEING